MLNKIELVRYIFLIQTKCLNLRVREGRGRKREREREREREKKWHKQHISECSKGTIAYSVSGHWSLIIFDSGQRTTCPEPNVISKRHNSNIYIYI